jgi:hypothetical protein
MQRLRECKNEKSAGGDHEDQIKDFPEVPAFPGLEVETWGTQG